MGQTTWRCSAGTRNTIGGDRFDLPPFGVDFTYVQKFPIWGPLFARITGSVGLTIDLAFGYDTFGVRKFAQGEFSNPLDLIAVPGGV